ncbi:10621_t:CDS:2 [Acaulospora colombiana]|uniref:10621_t:CDS:1 n=1 Tax=Acaulospora colombiana TaxID=27376 RepID=A0ACA9KRS8_9GLOM|nr:10621_t:CDS:2 [Acaulospora colombiana]
MHMEFIDLPYKNLRAIPIFEEREEKLDTIGPETHTLGVRFKDLYASLAKDLKKINAKYVKATDAFHDASVEAAKKDKLPPPKFFDTWNKKYVKYVKLSEKAAVELFKRAEGFGKKLEEAPKKH